MISGTTFAYKAIEHDYCLAACIYSLLPAVEELVVLDCGGGDGTSELIEQIAASSSRIRVMKAEWKPDNAAGKWLADLVNQARSYCHGHYHVHLQADEVLHENSYAEIRRLAREQVHARCTRYNFWRDRRHLVPPGQVCGTLVVRCAPMYCPSIGDAEQLQAENPQLCGVEIFHYGFLRKPESLRRKAILMEDAIVGSHNSIWNSNDPAKEVRDYFPDQFLPLFKGYHPQVIEHWLQERGH